MYLLSVDANLIKVAGAKHHGTRTGRLLSVKSHSEALRKTMVFDGRYIANEPTFKRHAYAALKSRFPDEAAFEDFYASLDTPQLKDQFLHAATFYLFLAKQGEWHVTVEGSAPVVDYLSTSFKVVALFALIESLSDEQHQDFYDWLVSSRDPDTTFPIGDSAALTKLYLERDWPDHTNDGTKNGQSRTRSVSRRLE
jgi:hypothetical protein